jgi:hypothetical protein
MSEHLGGLYKRHCERWGLKRQEEPDRWHRIAQEFLPSFGQNLWNCGRGATQGERGVAICSRPSGSIGVDENPKA